MGCSSSKPVAQDGPDVPARRPMVISGPTGGPVQVPPPYRDQFGRPINHNSAELNAGVLQAALGDMATYLDQRRQQVTLVTVGGAVNTMYLRSRPSTHDVDFFLGDATASVHNVIHEAARYANRQRGGQLGAEWLNNATQLFMKPATQRHLFDAATQQGSVVFQHRALTVFAAPWHYAFCGKLNRLSDKNPRPYDLADAVAYLQQYLQTHQRRTVPAQEVARWCQQYQKACAPGLLRRVNDEYERRYGARVITN